MAEHSVEIHHQFKSPNGSEVVVIIDQAANTIEVLYKLRGGEEIGETRRIDRLTLAELADLFGDADKLLAPAKAHSTVENTLPQES